MVQSYSIWKYANYMVNFSHAFAKIIFWHVFSTNCICTVILKINYLMKKVFILTLVALSSALLSFQTDSDSIVKALKAGNAETVAAHFDSFIDLKLPEKDEVKNMGKNQASIALRAFFTDNTIKGFELTSQREIGGTMYMAGKLKNNGKGFNITIMLKKNGDKQEIITIRIN